VWSSLSYDLVTEMLPDDEFPGEGPSTAAYDFEQARIDISATQREIRTQERIRRHARTTLVGILCSEAIVLAVLYLTRLPGAPIQLDMRVLTVIDIAAALVAAAAIYRGIRLIAQKTKSIDGLRHTLMQHRTAERDAKSRLPIGSARLLWTYHSDVLDTIDQYRDSALRYRRVHNWFQNIIIVGSLMTTGITTAALKFAVVEWAAIVVSFTVGLSAGMTGYYKFRERSMNLQQAGDELEQEHKAVELGIRAYRKFEGDERLVEFAERAEGIKDEQRKREQQLEQPPDGREGTAGASSSPN
jgi:hypothetical protein